MKKGGVRSGKTNPGTPLTNLPHAFLSPNRFPDCGAFLFVSFRFVLYFFIFFPHYNLDPLFLRDILFSDILRCGV